MKQRITLDQILSLKPEGLDRLEEWVEPRGYTLMLTIGQMIEYLDRGYSDAMIQDYYEGMDCPTYCSPDKLCDALWEACKDTLERKEDDL